MKKWVILLIFIIVISCSVFSQGLYLDVGFGYGKARTVSGGKDILTVLKTYDLDLKEIGVDWSLKIGFGIDGYIPIYVIAEYGGVGHRIFGDFKEEYVQFDSYIIGPGVIVYLARNLQIGGTIGYSYVKNQTNIEGLDLPEKKDGKAWNVYGAFDIGGERRGILLGVKYFVSEDALSGGERNTMLGVFIKYVIRRR